MIASSNEVCKPTKPTNNEALTSRCLAVLLDGGILNRKTLEKMGIAAYNTSLPSIMSTLRNEQYIPIKSHRLSDNTCNYHMEPEEIARYKSPDLRKMQNEEMRMLVEKKRQKKIIGEFLKFVLRLNERPHLWRYMENLSLKLNEIEKEINALLTNKKGVN